MPYEDLPIMLNYRGASVESLHVDLGKLNLHVPENETAERLYGAGTEDAVRQIQARHRLPVTGVFDETTRQVVEGAVASATAAPRIEGRLYFESGAPADRIKLRLYERAYGGKTLKPIEGSSDDNGYYSISFARPKWKLNQLELRAVDATGNETLLAVVAQNSLPYVRVDGVVAETLRTPEPEYGRVHAALLGKLGKEGKLADAEETGGRSEVSLLAQETGLDVELVSHAVAAAKAAPILGIEEEALYALFRAGFPAERSALSLINPAEVGRALSAAHAAGVVNMGVRRIAKTRKDFQAFADASRDQVRSPASVSTFTEMLGGAGLKRGEQQIFHDLRAKHKGTGDQFWADLQEKLPKSKVESLRLQGHLGHLTDGNAPLIAALTRELKLSSSQDLSKLAGAGLYKEGAWRTSVNRLPPADRRYVLERLSQIYPGATSSERMNAYATEMARKIRISFPMRVLREKINGDELRLGTRAQHTKDKPLVLGFLNRTEKFGFELGRTPLGPFIMRNEEELFRGQEEEEIKASKRAVRKLQRLYQISPSDVAMQVLYDLDLSSAQDIAHLDEAQFVRRFTKSAARRTIAGKFGSPQRARDQARLIHRKARQVQAVTLNILNTVRQMETAPDLHALSGPSAASERTSAIQRLTERFPTLETLFGATDFCECAHCRSVLSPAAYLVDLLEFLNPNASAWSGKLDEWVDDHHFDYPFRDQEECDRWVTDNSEAPPRPDKINPYEALVRRRPDLPHLPLTCENTNTEMPYIDLVNEILEYYVANGKLAEDAAQDTGCATTEALLAEPQNIRAGAYDILRDKDTRYPLNLPFDLWLETTRAFLEQYDMPLWKLLEDFQNPVDPEQLELFEDDESSYSYYRAEIYAEYLGLSSGEYQIYTATDFSDWYTLYGYHTDSGYDPEARARDELRSAKTLSRKLGVSYKELVELVMTRFVNPGLSDLEVLWKLDLEVNEIVSYFEFRDDPDYEPKRLILEQRFSQLDDKFSAINLDTKSTLEKLWEQGILDRALVLRDYSRERAGEVPNAVLLSDFNTTMLEHANKQPADDIDYLCLNLFVRLRAKLGWSIRELDQALCSFMQRDLQQLDAASLGTAFKTALVYLAHLKRMDDELKLGKDSLLNLITLWKDIPTSGQDSLYAQLFFAHRTRKLVDSASTDAAPAYVFDHRLGKYLQYFDDTANIYKPFWWNAEALANGETESLAEGRVPLSNHIPELQDALGLTFDEVQRILIATRGSCEDQPLTLANVSVLYRYKVLADALHVTVKDLITLKLLSGLDPFEPLKEGPLTKQAEDNAYVTRRFVTIVQQMKDAGLDAEYLGYLLLHRFDPLGQYRADGGSGSFPGFARALLEGYRSIDREMGEQGVTPTDAALEQQLATVMSSDEASDLISLLTGTTEFKPAPAKDVEPDKALDAKLLAAEPAIQVSYNQVLKEQYLTYRGVLLEKRKEEIESWIAGSTVLDSLLTAAQNQLQKAFSTKVKRFADSLTYEAITEIDDAAKQINPQAFNDKYAIHPSYDSERRIQRLRYDGVLLNADDVDLMNVVEGDSSEATLSTLLQQVKRQGQNDLKKAIKAWVGRLCATIEFHAVGVNKTREENKLDSAEFVTSESVTPEPQIRVEYDATNERQHLYLRGLLTSSRKAQLLAGSSHSGLLGQLLGEIESQAKAFILSLAEGYLAADDFADVIGDSNRNRDPNLDDFPAGLQESQGAMWQAVAPLARAESFNRVTTEVTSTLLDADPETTAILSCNANLMACPDQPERTLVDALEGLCSSGVDVSFYKWGGEHLSSDITSLAEVVTPPKVATADGPGWPSGTHLIRFDGYLEPPADGVYRIYTSLEKQDAKANFRLSSDGFPAIDFTARHDRDETSALLELKGGTLYQFVFEAARLGEGTARLEIEGENLPRGGLAREERGLYLHPRTAIERADRVMLLLQKSFDLIGKLELSARDVRYVLEHRTRFDNIDLSHLAARDAVSEFRSEILKVLADRPSADAELAEEEMRHADPALAAEADSFIAEANRMFKGVYRLVQYAALKQAVSKDADDLVDVLERAWYSYPELPGADEAEKAHFEPLANLLGCQPEEARDIAGTLGMEVAVSENGVHSVEVTSLEDDRGIRRVWEVYKLLRRLGVGAETAASWATPTPDEGRARDIRDAIKGRYEGEAWLRVAKPVFDRLRKAQRDALVVYIMEHKGFKRPEQLFEYFLVDPAMEPVVRTSRIQLAIASVQTFIQRCFLDLEDLARPSALDSDRWEWMKQYRVWEANRKIFLYPENWLEPEFRDDKSHLFQKLESTLLQGDVSNELAEDAFFNYLTGLEELARLQIVALCYEDEGDPDDSIVHVIARTHNQPHKYFYRRRSAGGTWVPWEPVGEEIEGDHIVAIFWRNRLHVFWVTFQEKAASEHPGNDEPTLESLKTAKSSELIEKRISLQLNWIEYFQGKWRPRSSSGFDASGELAVPQDFNKDTEIFIHASKEVVDGQDGAVKVNLHFNRLVKNGRYMALADQLLASKKATAAGINSALRSSDSLLRTTISLASNSQIMSVNAGKMQLSTHKYTSAGDYAFRLSSKNSVPEFVKGDLPVNVPFSQGQQFASQSINSYNGSGDLDFVYGLDTIVEYHDPFNPLRGEPEVIDQSDQYVFGPILKGVGKYTLRFSKAPKLLADDDDAYRRAFFYEDQDYRYSFFVEPQASTIRIQDWQFWGEPPQLTTDV